MSPTFPVRSPGVRWEPLGDGLLLHDEMASQVHLLSQAGALVWASCDGATTLVEVAAEVAEVTGLDAAQVEVDLAAHVDQLLALGLVGRGEVEPSVQLGPPLQATGPHRVGPFRIVDTAAWIVSEDQVLLDEPAALLADLRVDEGWAREAAVDEVEVELGHHEAAIRIRGRGFDTVLPACPAVAELLVAQLNRAVTWAPSPLALHAGAVRSPEGTVVAIAGPSGSGKSTLVAQLVQAGWDYLTDEALGLGPDLGTIAYPKPLALAPASRRALGLGEGPDLVRADELRAASAVAPGAAGPLAAVVVAAYAPGSFQAERLDVGGAAALVAPNAINLAAAGQVGLRSLAHLLGNVPAHRLVHGGGDAVTRWFADLGRSA
ncbi:MAG: PqqD family peptide modification chaperone [Acidimicrobiales bacterium]